MNSHLAPIGLFGGTFDPIHRGHFQIADELIAALRLESVQFIPNHLPDYRTPPEASATHRLTMVRLATANHPKCLVNDIEIQRPSPTHTIDTLSTLREMHPTQPFCFIVGADAFSQINTWYEWESMFALVHFVVINRPPASLPREGWMEALLSQYQTDTPNNLRSSSQQYIYQHTLPPIEISASKIRQQIKVKRDVTNAITPEVWQYIQQHHLYNFL